MDASTYALHEAHNDEKVTIAADPVDAQKMAGVFKENYWKPWPFSDSPADFQ